jgi:hypothetical protein
VNTAKCHHNHITCRFACSICVLSHCLGDCKDF